MTFNSIRKDSYKSTPLPEQSAPTNAAGSMENIQAVVTTTKTISTNAPHASSPPIGTGRYTFSFFNSKTERFPIKLIDRLASLNIAPERRLIALQQITDEATASIKEIAIAIEELDVKVEASQEKEMGFHIVSRFKALSETIQAISIQSQESATDATFKQGEFADNRSEQEKFADVMNDLELYELMADSFSVAQTCLSNELVSLLGNSKGLSIQEQTRWKDLVKEERTLYEQMKTQIKTIAKCIDITDTQIKIGTGDDAKAVRTKLVDAHNSILHTLRQADQYHFPHLPSAEHVVNVAEGYQHYMELHDSLMQRAKSLEEDLLLLTRNRHTAEKELAPKETQPEQEVNQAEKQTVEPLNLLESFELKGILSGTSAPSPIKTPKKVRFNTNVEAHPMEKHDKSEGEQVELESSVDKAIVADESRINSESSQVSATHESNASYKDTVGISYEDVAKNRGKDRSGQYFGPDIGNLADFKNEKK